MPGPRTAAEALPWAQEAMRLARYITHPHFWDRCQDRHLGIDDVRHAVANAVVSAVSVYADRPPENGGTCWRLVGPSLEENEAELKLGFEAFRDQLGQRLLLVTVM